MLKNEVSLKESWVNGGSISLSDFGFDTSPLSWKGSEGVLCSAATGHAVLNDISCLTSGFQIDETTGRITMPGESERSLFGVVEDGYGYLQVAAFEVFERWRAFEATRFIPMIRFFSVTSIESVPSILIRGTLWVRGTVTKSFISIEDRFSMYLKMLRAEVTPYMGEAF